VEGAMNFLKGLLMLTLVTAFVAGQMEHAPTVQQCQADERLWMNKIEETNLTIHPDYITVNAWFNEMRDCQSVDPANKIKYYNLQSEIVVENAMRLQHFVMRHEMWEQFIKEDAAGKR
jgi:hypothetical protein